MYDNWLSRLAFWLLFNVAIAFCTLGLNYLLVLLNHTTTPSLSGFFVNGELFVIAFAITIEALAGLAVSNITTNKFAKIFCMFVLLLIMLAVFAGMMLMVVGGDIEDKKHVSQSSFPLFMVSLGICSSVRIWIKL